MDVPSAPTPPSREGAANEPEQIRATADKLIETARHAYRRRDDRVFQETMNALRPLASTAAAEIEQQRKMRHLRQ